jgi:hypothetical protein
MKFLPDYIKVEEIESKILPLLQDPKRLRLAVILGIGIIGLGGIGMPMRMKMRSLEKELVKESRRQEIITSIQRMKTKLKVYTKHLNKKGDLNWWIEYILNSSRKCHLKIREYKPFTPKTLAARPGAFKGYLLQFQVDGNYRNLFKFVNWIESNKWSMRIPRLVFQKERGGTAITANITIAVLTSRALRKISTKTNE